MPGAEQNLFAFCELTATQRYTSFYEKTTT